MNNLDTVVTGHMQIPNMCWCLIASSPLEYMVLLKGSAGNEYMCLLAGHWRVEREVKPHSKTLAAEVGVTGWAQD